MKYLKNVFARNFLFLACVAFFFACSEENPFSDVDNDLDNMQYRATKKYEQSKSDEDDADYLGNGDYVDRVEDAYGVRSSSSMRRSSSSTDEVVSSPKFDYLTNSKTMRLTLTHYKQIVCSLEGKGSKTCNYSDGDPRISFEILFIQSNGSKTKYSTRDNLGKNWFYYDNLGEWNGERSFEVNVPALTDTIEVCPKVMDVEGFDDRVSSTYCYYSYHVGLLGIRETIYQSDYMSEKCELEWEWYLY